jgi:cobalt-zinc-cadmium efflux system protein
MAGRDHAHHGPGHSHAPDTYGRAFALGIGMNVAFVAVEAVFGFLSNSMALVADAGHNLSDVLGLVVAWAASVLTRRPATDRFTYGLRGSSILAALFNATILLVAIGAIAWEAVRRLLDPHPVAGMTVMVVAGIGIAINGATAWLFASGGKGDLNIRGAFLHMFADAVVSAGVVVAGLLILWTGALWIDPLVSLAVVGVVAWSTWGLLREGLAMSLSAVPPGIAVADVRAFLASQPGVDRVHHLHVWPISTTEVALTGHLVMPGGHPGDAFLARIAHDLDHRFGVHHSTLQIELGDPGSNACPIIERPGA